MAPDGCLGDTAAPGCIVYRADGKPLIDGGYPASVALAGNRRLIVDYVNDGELHAIVGYDVAMP